MTNVNANHKMERLIEQTASLHKHLCPRQVLGVRMGVYAAELFSMKLPQNDKRLLTFVETDGCFTDGVGIATGCSMGHRTMRLMDYGKVAATFVDTRDGRALRCCPSPDARQRAAGLVPEAASHWHAQLSAYQQMPAEQLFQVREVAINLDLCALIGKPGARTACHECGEEILNQREVVRNGHPTCQSCAGDHYWSLKSS